MNALEILSWALECSGEQSSFIQKNPVTAMNLSHFFIIPSQTVYQQRILHMTYYVVAAGLLQGHAMFPILRLYPCFRRLN
jgi:hypothetical protein